MTPTEPEIVELLEELRAEAPERETPLNPDSHMVVAGIYELKFDAEESALLLSSPESVRRLFVEFEVGSRLYSKRVAVELHSMELGEQTMAELEKQASLVEEM